MTPSQPYDKPAGIPVLEDTHNAEFGTAPVPLRCDNAIFYAGWYSPNNYNDAFSWKPGAIAFHIALLRRIRAAGRTGRRMRFIAA